MCSRFIFVFIALNLLINSAGAQKLQNECMTYDRAKSMMMGHWRMMVMMMNNSNMMVEIMKSDSTLFNEVMTKMVNVVSEDSAFRNDFLSSMMKDKKLKDAM